VTLHFGQPSQRAIGLVPVSELRAYQSAGHFAEGSMAPKVEAACRFVEGGGERAVITSLDRIADAVPDGRSASSRAETVVDDAGTVVVAER